VDFIILFNFQFAIFYDTEHEEGTLASLRRIMNDCQTHEEEPRVNILIMNLRLL
jgi:hypothetical protein